MNQIRNLPNIFFLITKVLFCDCFTIVQLRICLFSVYDSESKSYKLTYFKKKKNDTKIQDNVRPMNGT